MEKIDGIFRVLLDEFKDRVIRSFRNYYGRVIFEEAGTALLPSPKQRQNGKLCWRLCVFDFCIGCPLVIMYSFVSRDFKRSHCCEKSFPNFSSEFNAQK
jgi:hypothetical protein